MASSTVRAALNLGLLPRSVRNDIFPPFARPGAFFFFSLLCMWPSPFLLNADALCHTENWYAQFFAGARFFASGVARLSAWRSLRAVFPFVLPLFPSFFRLVPLLFGGIEENQCRAARASLDVHLVIDFSDRFLPFLLWFPFSPPPPITCTLVSIHIRVEPGPLHRSACVWDPKLVKLPPDAKGHAGWTPRPSSFPRVRVGLFSIRILDTLSRLSPFLCRSSFRHSLCLRLSSAATTHANRRPPGHARRPRTPRTSFPFR